MNETGGLCDVHSGVEGLNKEVFRVAAKLD